MSGSKLIFRLKEGVEPSEVFPDTVLNAPSGEDTQGGEDTPSGEENGVSVSRLYGIENEVAEFRNKTSFLNGDFESDEEVFNHRIYETKSETERKLYRTYVAQASRDTADSLFKSLENNENVEYVQYNEMNKLCVEPPNDAHFGELWGIRKIDCLTAWETSQGEDVVVAVIDSGVDYEHPDISGNMWTNAAGKHGFDFFDNGTDPMDEHGHGSHCAGIIAATLNNQVGVVGVAPKAKIMAVKVFPNMTDEVCAKGIKFAADNGAGVLSNSWGPEGRRVSNPTIEDAIDYAADKGFIVVFAAGNDVDNGKFFYSVRHPRVISVGSVNIDDQRAGSSNFGSLVTVAAPGVDILSLRVGTDGYTRKSGTSMACPHVAGLVALLLAKRPNLTFSEIKQILQDNGDIIQTDRPVGRRINAARSLSALAAPPPVAAIAPGTGIVEKFIERIARPERETV